MYLFVSPLRKVSYEDIGHRAHRATVCKLGSGSLCYHFPCWHLFPVPVQSSVDALLSLHVGRRRSTTGKGAAGLSFCDLSSNNQPKQSILRTADLRSYTHQTCSAPRTAGHGMCGGVLRRVTGQSCVCKAVQNGPGSSRVV